MRPRPAPTHREHVAQPLAHGLVDLPAVQRVPPLRLAGSTGRQVREVGHRWAARRLVGKLNRAEQQEQDTIRGQHAGWWENSAAKWEMVERERAMKPAQQGRVKGLSVLFKRNAQQPPSAGGARTTRMSSHTPATGLVEAAVSKACDHDTQGAGGAEQRRKIGA